MEMHSAVHPDTVEFRVDIHTLKEFGVFMRRELDENIGPMASRVSPTLANGAVVAPHLPSGDVEAMNFKHADCVIAMTQQLQSYAANLAIIADAAAAIAERYATSDALARASLNGIAPGFNTAIGQDSPLPPDTPHGGLV